MSFVAIYRTNDPKWRTAESGAERIEVLADFVNPSTGEPVKHSDGYALPTEYVDPSSGFTGSKGDPIILDGMGDADNPSAPYSTFKGVLQHDWASGVPPSDLVTDVAYTPLKQQLEGNNPVTRMVFRTIDVNGVAPLSSHVGQTVQVAFDATNGWGIDTTLTSDGHCYIMDVLSPFNQYVVRFVDTAIQT